MITITLSASEKAILHHLSNAANPSKSATHEAARKAAGLTVAGYQTVRRRMIEKLLIAWTPSASGIQITFRGMRAVESNPS